jgi:hypothetical protein
MKPSTQAVVAGMIAVLVSGTAFGQVKSDEPVKTTSCQTFIELDAASFRISIS